MPFLVSCRTHAPISTVAHSAKNNAHIFCSRSARREIGAECRGGCSLFLCELASESIGGHGDDVMYGAVGGVFTVMMSCMGLLVVFTCLKTQK